MRRQPTCCQSCLAFILKFLNYLQTFMGVSIVVYSAFLLNHWNYHGSPPSVHPPQLHSKAPSQLYYPSSSVLDQKVMTIGQVTPRKLVLELNLNLDADNVLSEVDMAAVDGVYFNIHSLPTPWFIYAFMGVGVMLCCITCIGHVGAEAMNGCCLCFHAILITLFVLLEITFVAFITIDRQWEQDLPVDSTGELDRFRVFFEENREVCEWICIAVVIIQVSSLLLSIILRALLNQKSDLDDEDAYDIRERPWEPLLHPHLSEASGSIRSDTRGGTHSDTWSSRMREKYGLIDGDSKRNLANQNAASDMYPGH